MLVPKLQCEHQSHPLPGNRSFQYQFGANIVANEALNASADAQVLVASLTARLTAKVATNVSPAAGSADTDVREAGVAEPVILKASLRAKRICVRFIFCHGR